MSDHPLDPHRDTLAAWLADRLDVDSVSIDAFDDPKSGYSAETTMIDISTRGGGDTGSRRLVLRRETPEPPIYPVQAPGIDVEISIQYRVMEALTGQPGIPLAGLVGYEEGEEVLGAPFFVMEFVDGEVPVEDPPYPTAGFFFDATPAQRTTMVEEGIEALAAVHAVDWGRLGLGWLVPPGVEPTVERQLRLWQEQGRNELDGRVHHELDRAWVYLWSDVPDGAAPALNWGDPRLGNVIWRDARPACLTDFEAACIAPPEVDLGWWLMFDHWSHESMGIPRLDGEPSRAAQRERYAAARGRDPGDTTWYEIFAAARYCVIVVRVMNRLVQRGLLPEDNTLWHDTPATTCVRLYLDDV